MGLGGSGVEFVLLLGIVVGACIEVCVGRVWVCFASGGGGVCLGPCGIGGWGGKLMGTLCCEARLTRSWEMSWSCVMFCMLWVCVNISVTRRLDWLLWWVCAICVSFRPDWYRVEYQSWAKEGGRRGVDGDVGRKSWCVC